MGGLRSMHGSSSHPIPPIKVIIRILKVCSNRTDHSNPDTKTTDDREDHDNEGRYLAITSAPLSQPQTKETDFNSNNIILIAQNQERPNREIKFLEQGNE